MCGIAQQPSYPTGVKAVAPGPGPSPPPPAPSTSHYEDPKPNGCQSDEQAIQIQGVKGDFCTPKCTTDVPSGVTARPQCALKDTSGNKYCALICSPSTDEASLRAGDAQCGKATCKAIQGVGLCTYDD